MNLRHPNYAPARDNAMPQEAHAMHATPRKSGLSASTFARSTLLVLCAGLATMAAPQVADADYKTSSGTACMPYGSNTSWDELLYLSGGVGTRGDADEYVLCGFSSDSENGWYSASTNADLQLYFKAGGADAAVACTATAGSSFMYGVMTYGTSLSLPATLAGTMSIGSIQAPMYSWTPLTVTCRLPGKATLARLVLNERGVTGD